ncbi:hypothetical protein [Streptomyces sp. NPDC004284]
MSRLSTGRTDLPCRISGMRRCVLPAPVPPDVIAGIVLPAAPAQERA